MQKTPTFPLLPSASFLLTLHSDLDFVPNKEESKFKTTVTDNNIESFFEVYCTRVTIKTQTTNSTPPKDSWRTLEAARHHSLHLAEDNVNNFVLLPNFQDRLFFRLSKKMTMIRTNHFIKMFHSRTTGALQYKS